MQGKFVLGLDIGGTKIGFGLVGPNGKIIKKLRVPTHVSRGKSAVLKAISTGVDNLWVKGVKGVGVGIAGLVDHQKGILKFGPNMPAAMTNFNLGAYLQKRYKVPVKVDNDVHCFTLAEAKYGVAKGKNLVVGVTFGTGIGGGVVLGGQILRGKHNGFGEIGHMIVDLTRTNDHGRKGVGDFESLASGRAMSAIYKGLSGNSVEPLEVQNAAGQGDHHAIKTLTVMKGALASGLASLLYAYDPDIIVTGGGLSAVQILWKDVIKEARAMVKFPELKKTPIERSKLGSDANLLGAALLISEKQ